MKKWMLVVAALATVALLATSASALPIAGSLYNGSIDDRSNIFSNLDSDPALEPESFGASVDAGDEQRNIFTIDELAWQGTKADIGGPGDVFGGDSYSPYVNAGSGTLHGMLYDVVMRGTESGGNGASFAGGTDVLYFEAGSRYVAGTDWVDNYKPGGFDAATITGAGGIMVVYEDNTPDADRVLDTELDSLLPSSWTEKNVATTDASILTGNLDGMPVMSDVEPWLIMVLMPNPLIGGQNAQSTDLLAEVLTVSPPSVQGVGTLFANVIGGTATQDTAFWTDLFGPGLDVKLNFSVFQTDFVDPTWQLISRDPIMFGAIPEPLTIGLLGFGLTGLVLRRRRKK